MVFDFGENHRQLLQGFFKRRIDLELTPASQEVSPSAKEDIGNRTAELRGIAEEEIRRRLVAIRNHMNKQGSSYVSMDRIYSSIQEPD